MAMKVEGHIWIWELFRRKNLQVLVIDYGFGWRRSMKEKEELRMTA